MGPPNTFIGGNNEIGLALIMTMPLMRYLQLQAKKIWVKWGLMAAMGLTFVAIFWDAIPWRLAGAGSHGRNNALEDPQTFCTFSMLLMVPVLSAGLEFECRDLGMIV